jgi:hypothetical protein
MRATQETSLVLPAVPLPLPCPTVHVSAERRVVVSPDQRMAQPIWVRFCCLGMCRLG